MLRVWLYIIRRNQRMHSLCPFVVHMRPYAYRFWLVCMSYRRGLWRCLFNNNRQLLEPRWVEWTTGRFSTLFCVRKPLLTELANLENIGERTSYLNVPHEHTLIANSGIQLFTIPLSINTQDFGRIGQILSTKLERFCRIVIKLRLTRKVTEWVSTKRVWGRVEK